VALHTQSKRVYAVHDWDMIREPMTGDDIMTSSDPHGHHDWHSQQYVEEWIASATARDPERRAILRRVASLIPRDTDAAIRVLDVGSGYGALSAQVLERFPRADLVCQDFSEPMFAQARERLGRISERISFVPCDLSDPNWTQALTGAFDAVVSGIAIHNVRYPDRIRGIYADLFDVVAPGGCFLNYDLIFVSGPAAARAYDQATHLAHWIRGESDDATGPAAATTAGQMSHQHEAIPLEEQLRWLREAGFREVECFWKEGRSAIIGGFRPF
jgi:tRNA (cmo5U34)-methyltransferase